MKQKLMFATFSLFVLLSSCVKEKAINVTPNSVNSELENSNYNNSRCAYPIITLQECDSRFIFSEDQGYTYSYDIEYPAGTLITSGSNITNGNFIGNYQLSQCLYYKCIFTSDCGGQSQIVVWAMSDGCGNFWLC